MSELKIGTTVRLTNGRTCKVKKELDCGGQGVVYAVDYGGKDHALKWYTAPSIINLKVFYKNLNYNVNAGSPVPNFIWPIVFAEPQLCNYGLNVIKIMKRIPKPTIKQSNSWILFQQ